MIIFVLGGDQALERVQIEVEVGLHQGGVDDRAPGVGDPELIRGVARVREDDLIALVHHRQQRLGEPAHALCVGRKAVEEVVAGRRIVFGSRLEDLDRPRDPGQRIPQFVSGITDEVALGKFLAHFLGQRFKLGHHALHVGAGDSHALLHELGHLGGDFLAQIGIVEVHQSQVAFFAGNAMLAAQVQHSGARDPLGAGDGPRGEDRAAGDHEQVSRVRLGDEAAPVEQHRVVGVVVGAVGRVELDTRHAQVAQSFEPLPRLMRGM